MREFILKASTAVTNPNFVKLNDIPGAGRLDVVCRCVSSALFISDSIRRDAIFHAVLEGPDNPPVTVSIHGSRARNLAPDERNIASHIRIALEKAADLKTSRSVESEPGIAVSKKSFGSLVKEKSTAGQLVYLHPSGTDIKKAGFKRDICIIVGDHKGLGRADEKLMENLGELKVSLGSLCYLASSCISMIHNEIDRRMGHRPKPLFIVQAIN